MIPGISRSQRATLGRVALPLAVLWLLASCVNAQDALPSDRLLKSLQPTADVNDFAGILSPDQKESLEQICRRVRESTGAQLAVVVLKSLEGGQVDDFAVRLFKQWGIGQKDEQNGVLLLVAIDDRKARIEVGYGLEPILPDALAGRILNDQLFPAFKQQQYAEGLTAAIERMAQIIEKNEPAPADAGQPDAEVSTFAIVGMLSLFVAIGSFILGAGLGRRSGCLAPQMLFFVGIPFLIGCSIAFPWAPHAARAARPGDGLARLVGYAKPLRQSRPAFARGLDRTCQAGTLGTGVRRAARVGRAADFPAAAATGVALAVAAPAAAVQAAAGECKGLKHDKRTTGCRAARGHGTEPEIGRAVRLEQPPAISFPECLVTTS